MKNKNKGFTLIELLVVVAIIGILASVGVVAYNGYTESAKKAGVASNHANVMKTLGAEMAKCNIDDTVMETLTCKGRTSASVIAAAATFFNSKTNEYNNPFDAADDAGDIFIETTIGTNIVKGAIRLTDAGGGDVQIESCKSKDGCAPGSTDILVATVSID